MIFMISLAMMPVVTLLIQNMFVLNEVNKQRTDILNIEKSVRKTVAVLFITFILQKPS